MHVDGHALPTSFILYVVLVREMKWKGKESGHIIFMLIIVLVLAVQMILVRLAFVPRFMVNGVS